eukprot:4302767-Pleurochrysis_carterae.AAC.1
MSAEPTAATMALRERRLNRSCLGVRCGLSGLALGSSVDSSSLRVADADADVDADAGAAGRSGSTLPK